MNKKSIILLALASALLVSVGAFSDQTGVPPEPQIREHATFRWIEENIIKAKESGKLKETACAYCHSGSQAEDGFSAGSYKDVMDSGVTAGDPDKSPLYTSIANPNPDMPQNTNQDVVPLSQEEQSAVYYWIKEGAKED